MREREFLRLCRGLSSGCWSCSVCVRERERQRESVDSGPAECVRERQNMCVCVGLQEAVIGIVRLQCVSVKEREIETLCVCVAQQGTVIGMLVLQCVCV